MNLMCAEPLDLFYNEFPYLLHLSHRYAKQEHTLNCTEEMLPKPAASIQLF